MGNPDFALVDEAYPYISKRLLTDDSPRLRESLRYMVYGKGEVFDADRLIDVLEAFETFRVASRTSQGRLKEEAAEAARAPTSPTPPNANPLEGISPPSRRFRASPSPGSHPRPRPTSAPPPAPPVQSRAAGAAGNEDAQTREALQFVLSPEGAFFREFLLDEAVKGIDALGRDNAARVLRDFGLGDARVPVLLPGNVFPRQVKLSPNVTAEDKATVESVTKLLNFLLRGSRNGGTRRARPASSDRSSRRWPPRCSRSSSRGSTPGSPRGPSGRCSRRMRHPSGRRGPSR